MKELLAQEETEEEYFQSVVSFAQVYADPKCEECDGCGAVHIWDQEPWGETYTDVYKGCDVCTCVSKKLNGVSFRYYTGWTRGRDYFEEEDQLPF